MKKFMMILAASSLLVAACGDDKGGDEEGSEDGQENTDNGSAGDDGSSASDAATLALDGELDMSSVELPVVMPAPAGTEIVDEGYGYYIRNGETFTMEIIDDYDGSYSVEERKAEWDENDLNVVQSYVVDEANGFIAETEVMDQTEYHFFYVLEGSEGNYVFENEKGRSFSLAEAKLMYEAAKGATVIE